MKTVPQLRTTVATSVENMAAMTEEKPIETVSANGLTGDELVSMETVATSIAIRQLQSRLVVKIQIGDSRDLGVRNR